MRKLPYVMDDAMETASSSHTVSFEELQPGDEASLSRTITEADVNGFAALSGDANPLHMDDGFAGRTAFGRRVVHGMVLASYVSTLIGMRLPGPGSLWTQQSLHWKLPVFIGDRIDLTLRVRHKSIGTRTVVVEVVAVNQEGKIVMDGEGAVTMPEVRMPQEPEDLRTCAAFVTEASRGIGAAIANALAQAGAAVAVHCRENQSAAEKIADYLVKAGHRAIAVCADVRSPEEIRRALDAAVSAFAQPVDILINNGGDAGGPVAFDAMGWVEMQNSLDAHLRGAFECSKVVLPSMLTSHRGVIVNIGAAETWAVPPAQTTPWVVAKAALKALTRAMAAELGPNGIRINMVSPGPAESESLLNGAERLRKVQAMRTPLRRLATAEDVAGAVVFLCSNAGRFLTGVDIPVCGGMVM